LANASNSTAPHTLRLHNARALMAFEIDGRIDQAAAEIELAASLLPHVSDPLLRSNFINLTARTALYHAEYERAAAIAQDLIDEARGTGLDFVVDHALLTRASSFIGLRQLGAAARVLRELGARGASTSSWVVGMVALNQAYLHITSGDLEKAEVILRVPLPAGLPMASYGEWLAVRSIVLGGMGRISEAAQTATDARAMSCFIDTKHMSSLAEAIAAVHDDRRDARASARRGVSAVMRDGNRNSVVIACRAFPPLAQIAVGDLELEHAFTELFVSARDVDIGRAAGLSMPREFRRSEGLSNREEQVYELLEQGRTNLEIARTLFISESTVKVHVKHILEKLGVRTRVEAVAARKASS
jgi:DNA-binding NarL/FixJ family response regulator